jgi:DNA (cytosine-5)-methyltransferase 1
LKKNDGSLVLIGCSPCQYWSIINTDKKKSAKSKNLLIEFQRFAKYLNPGYIVVENVPGVLRKKEESGLQDFIDWLKEKKYSVHFDIHNVNDYGVPQNRKRFTLIANRNNNLEVIPEKTKNKKLVVQDVLGESNGFKKISAGTSDNTKFKHSTAGLSEINLERLKFVKKNGGNRLGFANMPALQLNCFKNKENSFKDTFGRLWWDKPAPTITTKFFSISNGRFVHPNENRALSIREGATLQSFPKTFEFKTTSVADTARIIGNAVPPEYAKKIGLAILKNYLDNGK